MKDFIRRNGSTILTVLGSIGVVGTAITTYKAATKTIDVLDKAQKEKGDELTKEEIVKKVIPIYIPVVVTGAATIACIFGANVLNKRHQASLMSAYALLDQSYKEYKHKLVELYGQEAHEKIVDAIAIEKAQDVYIHSECLCNSCDMSIEEHSSERRLFYDEYSSRYFEATIEQVILAEYHLNRNYILRGCAVLNELYEFLGLEPTDYGSVAGWAPLDEGMYWIDFNHRKVVMDDGLECFIIEMPFGPSLEYEDY